MKGRKTTKVKKTTISEKKQRKRFAVNTDGCIFAITIRLYRLDWDTHQ